MNSSTTPQVGDYAFKIITLGSPAVGKTSLIRRFADNKFDADYKTTLGVDITTKNINIGGMKICMLIVDPGGQDFFGKLRPVYYQGAQGAVFLFDLTRRSTFTDLPNWRVEFQSAVKKDVPIALVGNKCDLKAKISEEDIKEMVRSFDCQNWYLTSAKTGENVVSVYHDLAQQILDGSENSQNSE